MDTSLGIADRLFAPVRTYLERLPDGRLRLGSADPLGPFPDTVVSLLERRAAEHPDRPFLVELATGRSLSFGQAWREVQAVAQALLDLGATPERPVMVVAENGIRHALIALAAMTVGVPVSPVSPAYSKLSEDFDKLRHIHALLTPSVVFFDDAAVHARAVERMVWGSSHLIAGEGGSGSRVLRFDDLLDIPPTPAVASAAAALRPDTVAKVLFTSGSTAMPKGVMVTHRMMLSNQQALFQIWPVLGAGPLVLVDWLPWNHTFGGNQIINMALFHGGTLHIDPGKPVPGLFERTAESLRTVSPTVYFNVPRGLDLLATRLESDGELRRSFFARLSVLGYAGASLPGPTWERLKRLSLETTGRELPLCGMWGGTETAPIATAVHFASDHPGNIGTPLPGCELTLVPKADKLEARVKGANVTPGYWRAPELTAAAFDEEGCYRIGDALRFANGRDPQDGLLFDGRISENFKLVSGTWVNVGSVRLSVVEACPDLIADAAIAGHDREAVAALIFPKLPACRALCPDLPAEAPAAMVLADPRVRAVVEQALRRLAARCGGSSTRVCRALLLAEPPSIDGNEITDKGYLNQRGVLTRRAALVAALYTEPPGPEVIVAADGAA